MTQNSFEENLNKVKEIYPEIFQIILDCASNAFINFAIRHNHEFIWIHNYKPKNNISWINYDLPISQKFQMNVLARQISFDFVIKTKDFEKIKNEIPNGITLLQINSFPPDFVDLKKLKGKTRYELLKKECDFLFELDLPSAVDYGTIISPNRDYLNELLNDKTIDWTNLP